MLQWNNTQAERPRRAAWEITYLEWHTAIKCLAEAQQPADTFNGCPFGGSQGPSNSDH
jgi:hypothetical protein